MKHDPLKPKTPEIENLAEWENKNYYERLGISRDATTEEINKAFKILSVKYHPDKVSGQGKDLHDNYTKIYQMLSEAKTALADENKRQKYNKTIPRHSYESQSDEWEEEDREFYRRHHGPPESTTNKEIKPDDILNYFKEEIDRQSDISFTQNFRKKLNALELFGGEEEMFIMKLEQAIIEYFVSYFKLHSISENPGSLFSTPFKIETLCEIAYHQRKIVSKETLLAVIEKDAKNALLNALNPKKLPSTSDAPYPVAFFMYSLMKIGFTKEWIVSTMEDNGYGREVKNFKDLQ